MTKGVFREGDLVHVSYDGRKPIPMLAQQYRAKGYQPSFDALPTREQYERPGIGSLIADRNRLRFTGGEGGFA